MIMEYRFVDSQKGKGKLVADGYVYTHERSRGVNHYFRCENRGSCQARGTLKGVTRFDQENGTFTPTKEHNHAKDESRFDVLEAIAAMREAATLPGSGPSSIVQHYRTKIPVKTAPNLPTEDALTQMIRRERKKLFPAQPQTVRSITIPEFLKTTIDQGDRFLLLDTGEEWEDTDEEQDTDDERIIVFCSDLNLKYLAGSAFWGMDGTFKTAPLLFKQIFTIHAHVQGDIVPLVYAFLPQERQKTYALLFRELVSAAATAEVTLQPQFIMTDFELATIRALQEVFPQASVRCCLFHLAQSIHRKVQTTGLMEDYENDDEFRLSIKMLSALSFYPAEEIPTVYEELRNDAPARARNLYKYFEETYVLGRPLLAKRGKGRPKKGGPPRHPPRFPPELWSVSDLIEANFPRTNNSLESWHRRFEAVVGKYHANIYVIIEEFRKEDHKVHHQLRRREAGQYKRIGRPQLEKERRILAIVAKRDTTLPNDFLRGISHNMGDDGSEQIDDDVDEEDEEDFGVFF